MKRREREREGDRGREKGEGEREGERGREQICQFSAVQHISGQNKK